MSLDSLMQSAYTKNILLGAGIAIAALYLLWALWRLFKGKPGAILIAVIAAAAILLLYGYLTREP